ncbi:hypothetical protein F9B85_07810 [Heliorestis acidaminivorans]|uniref:Uncharacterized protein n=1 Tax=Heliorestis acidaminivorans TaxID=553427 RepID=A0A6I0EYS9_9FIRM|nr:hypothetical protein [Heliorestis acidaminivorans]KAB2952562.1 hypothetical protein F9B85_07810 [Heliorestis acidaminivorans]
MLTYEDVWEELLHALEESGLDIFDIQNFIETGSCLREFRCFCQVPDATVHSELKTEIAFLWDARMTASSLYDLQGSSTQIAVDSFSSSNEGSFQRGELSGPVLELEIKYYFPAKDFQWAGILTRRVQSIISHMVEPQKMPEVNFEISVTPEQQVNIHSAYAFYKWPLRLDSFEVQFDSLGNEISRILHAMHHSGHFEELL